MRQLLRLVAGRRRLRLRVVFTRGSAEREHGDKRDGRGLDEAGHGLRVRPFPPDGWPLIVVPMNEALVALRHDDGYTPGMVLLLHEPTAPTSHARREIRPLPAGRRHGITACSTTHSWPPHLSACSAGATAPACWRPAAASGAVPQSGLRAPARPPGHRPRPQRLSSRRADARRVCTARRRDAG